MLPASHRRRQQGKRGGSAHGWKLGTAAVWPQRKLGANLGDTVALPLAGNLVEVLPRRDCQRRVGVLTGSVDAHFRAAQTLRRFVGDAVVSLRWVQSER